jgi:putative Holliday junction resolvase
VAAGQTVTGTATALPVIRAKDGDPDWQQLETLVAQWKPDAFVIGMPYNMDGSENDMTAKALTFAKKIEEKFSRPCHLMDERLSTREAKDLSRANAEAGGRKFDDKTRVDSFAAQLILESWLAEYSQQL